MEKDLVDRIALSPAEVFFGAKTPSFPATSIARLQSLVNNQEFRQSIHVLLKDLEFGKQTPNANDELELAALYLHELTTYREVDPSPDNKGVLLSRDPIMHVYEDGGIDFLDGFTFESEKYWYVCKLWVPSTKSVLTYHRMMGNVPLLKYLRSQE